MQFKNWFFNQLPYNLFKKKDTYKDYKDEGLLERYLRNFGDELDEEIVPFIDNFMDLFDTLKCDSRMLPHLSFILGLPISIDNNLETYRRVLSYAVQIYKLKGTKQSYKLMFNLIGLDIQIIEELPGRAARYDDVVIYDSNPIARYDTTCDYCSYYSIAYHSVDDTINPVDINTVSPEVLALAQNIICFIQPINAKLRGMMRQIVVGDTLDIELAETINDLPTIYNGSFDQSFNLSFD